MTDNYTRVWKTRLIRRKQRSRQVIRDILKPAVCEGVVIHTLALIREFAVYFMTDYGLQWARRWYLPAPPIVTDRFVFPSGKTPYPSARTTLIGKGKVPGGD